MVSETTIGISKKNKEILNSLKIIPDETYDSVLTRIFNSGTVKCEKI